MDAAERISPLMIDPRLSARDSRDWQLPMGFVDLTTVGEAFDLPVMPAFPLIAIGDRGHPAAFRFDSVVESPLAAAALVAPVTQCPAAAAIAAQFLRALEGVPQREGLVLESMAYGLLQGGAEHRCWLAGRPGAIAPKSPGQLRLQRDGAVLCLMLDRPDEHNAIDTAMRDALFEAFVLAALDDEITRIELRASGRAFSIGGDLSEFGTTRDPVAAHGIRSRILPAIPLIQCAGKLDVHVQGACAGAGLEIAAFAQRFTASPGAWFQLPELAMGLIPGAGGCVSVPRRIGRQRTLWMILSGRRIGAATALAWGLIDAIEDRPAVNPGRDHSYLR